MEALDIEADNLIRAVAAVIILRNVEIGKEMASKLESRSILFVHENFKDAMSISKFVTGNSKNVELVVWLLNKFEAKHGQDQIITVN